VTSGRSLQLTKASSIWEGAFKYKGKILGLYTGWYNKIFSRRPKIGLHVRLPNCSLGFVSILLENQAIDMANLASLFTYRVSLLHKGLPRVRSPSIVSPMAKGHSL
jgi:hypothetical protein